MPIPNDSIFTSSICSVILPSFGSTLTLVPLGDVHHDAPGHDRKAFREFLANEARIRDPDTTIYLLMGDENDMGSFSERRELTKAKLHEATLIQLDQDALRRTELFRDAIKDLPGKFIGALQGNHSWAWLSNKDDKLGIVPGETTTNWLARELKCPWLGFLSYIRLRVGFRNTSARFPVDIVACHGKAGGKLVGTSINQVDDLRAIFPSADLYLMGHNHQRGGWPVTNLHATMRSVTKGATAQLHIKHRRQLLCRTGGFLRSYVENEQSYPVKRLVRPTDMGIITIKMKFQARRVNKMQTVDMVPTVEF